MSQVLTVDAILFGMLVLSGILGNILVIYVVFQSANEKPSRHVPASDLILVNISLANLLSSLFRTMPIFMSDLGLDVKLPPGWCRLLMLLWVWWRAVGCWATLVLSAFQCVTMRRQQVMVGPLVQRRERRHVHIALALVWGANLAFSLPALIYGTHVHDNSTTELMVISCTTRPLLGCVWEFPTKEQGLAFASASLALNEVVPLVLMVTSNLIILHALAKHIRSVMAGGESGSSQQKELEKQVAIQRKAGHVIIALVSLFVGCWVLQVAAVTYYNHNGGMHAEGLLTVSQFSASLFMGFSPMVVTLGHGKLRRRIVAMIVWWTNKARCQRGHSDKRVTPETQISNIKQTQSQTKDNKVMKTHEIEKPNCLS
ncbi:olfactory receptor class A-like protein 4 [Denticeps clupeoides]|uniref:G-protein coupled receptors family 1 profile domain-containing protein n=1 Tax=Denticeps clupeoides TaxID=299321 RepID=A0AAY4AZR4_9TELE|nr:olfactory receptor class A-like protein 4 [Denticeps clupeoides]